ncbi:MAG: glutamine-hydrolyzing carbamoyl-phosphate synthase small subunit [Nitrospirae bacterium]|nr:glutamine-hydrolyzing carbamoyl-phosphate synthase small subunit [Nitrospirota bacterium]
MNKNKAFLVLADGTVFEGNAFGALGEAFGEVVFNTSMTGYQEILTDPSYKGQLVAMTYTQIGNYGTNPEDVESGSVKAAGFIVKENIGFPSNWRSDKSLGQYLKDNGIAGIEGIDTRALTQHIRDNGLQNGIISSVDADPARLLEKVRKYPDISEFDFVKEVTSSGIYKWNEPLWRWDKQQSAVSHLRRLAEASNQLSAKRLKVFVYDFGVKRNILRHLYDVGFDVTVVPAETPAEEVIEKADCVLLSNGPGDPKAVTYAIETSKKLLGRKPVFGICLGHQIIGLALGGDTYKLKFGHHGGNHPVMDLSNGNVEITSQNHNYCVDFKSLKGQMMLTHKNLYDGTEEGLMHKELPVMTSQYHPEAGPGPNDSGYIFSRFRKMVEDFR